MIQSKICMDPIIVDSGHSTLRDINEIDESEFERSPKSILPGGQMQQAHLFPTRFASHRYRTAYSTGSESATPTSVKSGSNYGPLAKDSMLGMRKNSLAKPRKEDDSESEWPVSNNSSAYKY